MSNKVILFRCFCYKMESLQRIKKLFLQTHLSMSYLKVTNITYLFQKIGATMELELNKNNFIVYQTDILYFMVAKKCNWFIQRNMRNLLPMIYQLRMSNERINKNRITLLVDLKTSAQPLRKLHNFLGYKWLSGCSHLYPIF